MSQRRGAVDGQTARRAATDRAVTRHRPSSRRRDVNLYYRYCIQVFPGVLAHRPISRSATTIRDPLPRLCLSSHRRSTYLPARRPTAVPSHLKRRATSPRRLGPPIRRNRRFFSDARNMTVHTRRRRSPDGAVNECEALTVA